MYPGVAESDIRKIIQYGWRNVFIAAAFGCDVVIKNNSPLFMFITRYWKREPLRIYFFYKYRLLQKLRFLDRRRHIAWDGYYYTHLTPREYNAAYKKTGRKRRHLKVHHKFFHKYKEACRLDYNNPGYIVKFKYYFNRGFRFYKEDFVIDDPEILEYHGWLKFSDISISNYNYTLL